MMCTARQYVRFLPCWQPATAWAFHPRIFEMIRLLDLRAHSGVDLAGVRRALQLPVRVYVAAQRGFFVSKGAFCVGPSRRRPASSLAPGGMAHDPAGRQASERPAPL